MASLVLAVEGLIAPASVWQLVFDQFMQQCLDGRIRWDLQEEQAAENLRQQIDVALGTGLVHGRSEKPDHGIAPLRQPGGWCKAPEISQGNDFMDQRIDLHPTAVPLLR